MTDDVLPSSRSQEFSTAIEVLHTGTEWGEGPLWMPETRRLRWSDIPNNRILEWHADSGDTSVYRAGDAAEYPNGRTRDLGGAVVQCSHGRRRVERDVGGVVSSVVDRTLSGVRFNSPNDVIVDSSGVIWFSDPSYGILPEGLEGHPGEEEYGGRHVFRFDESRGELRAVITDLDQPNGLAFSVDETVLYVSDTGAGGGSIFAYDMVDGECVSRGGFARPDVPGSDGFRVDADGRVWSSCGDGVQVFDASGATVLRIPLPEVTSNLCFGGDDGADLFVTGATRLYRVRDAASLLPG